MFFFRSLGLAILVSAMVIHGRATAAAHNCRGGRGAEARRLFRVISAFFVKAQLSRPLRGSGLFSKWSISPTR